jgi:hypothetical protein
MFPSDEESAEEQSQTKEGGSKHGKPKPSQGLFHQLFNSIFSLLDDQAK